MTVSADETNDVDRRGARVHSRAQQVQADHRPGPAGATGEPLADHPEAGVLEHRPRAAVGDRIGDPFAERIDRRRPRRRSRRRPSRARPRPRALPAARPCRRSRGSTTKQTIDQTRSSSAPASSAARRSDDLPVVPVLELPVARPRRDAHPGHDPAVAVAEETRRWALDRPRRQHLAVVLPGSRLDVAGDVERGAPAPLRVARLVEQAGEVVETVRRQDLDPEVRGRADRLAVAAGAAAFDVIRRWRAGRSPAGPSPAANRSGGRPRSRRPRRSRASRCSRRAAGTRPSPGSTG